MANSAHYTNISSAVYSCLKTKLEKVGIHIEGDSGHVAKSGVSLDYNYNSGAKTLDITNVKVGFPASWAGYTPDKVIAAVTDAVKGCGGK